MFVAAPVVLYLLPLLSYHNSACALKLLKSAFTALSAPLVLAVFNDANTTDDNIPMIAITTSNSINVKPLCKYVFIKL